MGQRHQIFINTLNGAKVIATDQKKKIDTKRKEEFGDNDTTVLAYHHQWLYGFSAVIQALHVLEFNRDANDYNSPFKDSGIRYGGIISRDDVDAWVNSVTGLLSVFSHHLHRYVGTGRIGIERLHYLNKDESEMRENFDNGDNNDGITIIDTVSGKYCFMMLYEYQCEDKGLEPYRILSAADYVRNFYYPTDPEKWSDYDKEQFPGKKMEAEVKRRKRILARIEKEYKDFPVLTAEELVKIWPNYSAHLQQKSNSVVLS
jgi:hypothetical protein